MAFQNGAGREKLLLGTVAPGACQAWNSVALSPAEAGRWVPSVLRTFCQKKKWSTVSMAAANSGAGFFVGRAGDEQDGEGNEPGGWDGQTGS